MTNMTTWRKLIKRHLECLDLTLDDIECCTLSDDELDVPFDDGYGLPEGKSFTAWTKDRVLFPVVYDGSEWVGSAPRNPCEEAVDHIGGW